MGVYAHRFIEVIDKDNQWHLLPLWSKYKDSSYNPTWLLMCSRSTFSSTKSISTTIPPRSEWCSFMHKIII